MPRIVIVDDERLARRELREMLAAIHGVSVVGEAETVSAAAELVRVTEADTVLLDVQLEGELGFELLPQLPEGTQVIFVTAYERYAIRAFEQNAVDYLLKPVAPRRLAAAIARLEQPPRPAPPDERLSYDEFLFLRVDGRMQFVKLHDVAAISVTGDESSLWLRQGGALSVRKGLAEWEARLPRPPFVRIHRSAIVNLDHVDRVEDWSHASHRVYVRGHALPLPMSRRAASQLRARTG